MSAARNRDLLITALAPLIWGSTYLVTTEFLPPNRPFTAALIRVLPAGLLLLAYTRRAPARGEWARVVLLGVLNIGLFQAMLFVSAYRLPGGLAATLSSTQTLMILLLGWLIGKNMPPKAAWGWAAAGVAGIALMVLSPQARFDGWGMAAALTGAAGMALGVYLSKHWRISLNALAFTGWQLLFGGLFLLPAALLLETPPDTLTAANIGGYLYLSLFGAVFAASPNCRLPWFLRSPCSAPCAPLCWAGCFWGRAWTPNHSWASRWRWHRFSACKRRCARHRQSEK